MLLNIQVLICHLNTHDHLQGMHHKEVTKILKLVVTRSSSLVAAPQYPFLESNYSSKMCPTFADVEVFVKKELPGISIIFIFIFYEGRTVRKNCTV